MQTRAVSAALPPTLLARWVRLVGDRAMTRTVGESLLHRWSEPHRHYHDLAHLATVLDHIGDLVRADSRTPTDVLAAELAAYFHDAVYDPTERDNEARSADLAQEQLDRVGLPADRIGEVVRLVLLTATHDAAPADRTGALLCDADLAVLAANPQTYAAYAAAIRDEYSHVPEPLFRAGRAQLLARLLERPVLFRTRPGRVWWEEAARRNMGAELALLSAQTGGARGASGTDVADEARPPGAG